MARSAIRTAPDSVSRRCIAAARHRQHGGARRRVDGRQHVYGGAIALRVGRAAGHQPLAAEILHQQQPRWRVLGKDRRCRQADGAERRIGGEEGAGILRAEGGAAVADRRRRRPRPVHQHGAPAGRAHPLIAARRGIALDEAAGGAGEAGILDQRPSGPRAFDPAAPRRAAGQCRAPPVARDVEMDGEPVGGQSAGAPLGPFDEDGAVGHRVAEPDFVHLVGRAEAIEIEMADGQPAAHIGLHQREGRTRHLQAGVVGKRPDEGAGEGGLAGAKPARERNRVAGGEDRRHVFGKSVCRRFVGEGERQKGCCHRAAETTRKAIPPRRQRRRASAAGAP